MEDTRQKLEKRMDLLARRFAETKDPTVKRKIEKLSRQLAMVGVIKIVRPNR